MKILYVIVLLLLEIKIINGIKEYNIASMVDVKGSTVLSYNNHNYSATNVIDGNPSTLPDSCNCCWSSSDEQKPSLEVTLPQFEFVERIVVQGRTDLTDVSRILSGLNLQIDGNMVDETSVKYDSSQNKITVDLQNRPIKVLMLHRPRRSDPWFIIICEIYIYIQVDNLFERLRSTAITNQSSLFGNKDDFNSSKAIDGKNTYTLDSCMCCSVTDNDDKSPISWWQINLGKLYIAYGLEIFGREKINKDDNKQLQNASIFAGNSTLESIERPTTLLYNVPTIDTTTHFVHHLRNPMIAQFVKVQVWNKVLSLCEIVLYGRGYCNPGLFGLSCKSECHCGDEKNCHPWTGHCQTTGCLPGWQGQACNETCHLGQYGANCSSNCSINCLNGKQQCDSSSGLCKQGCEAGYMGQNCSSTCLEGSYGIGCNETCSNQCTNGTPKCDKASGMCIQGCKPGYTGAKCISECPLGTFGENCTGRCNCKNTTDCRKTDGYCTSGCAFGWKGFNCSEECGIGYFGTGCMQNCHCSDNKKCNQITGKCQVPGCLAGWQGEACDTVCDTPKFGNECNNTCHCVNGTACLNTNGTCVTKQCDPGWLLPTCSEECQDSQFGDGCNNTCHCKDGTSCNHISGECDIGLCEPGWLLPTCSEVCDHATFGDNCSSVCHCYNASGCNAVNGECDTGKCDPGWMSSSCDKNCDPGTFGDNCSSTCHCLNKEPCNSITGDCNMGSCDPGWQGSRCDQVCGHRRFGLNCTNTCHCKGNKTCNEVTGICTISGNCDPNWKGSSCSEASPSHTKQSNGSSAALGGGVGAAAALVVLGAIIGFIIFRRMRASRNTARKETEFSHLDKALEEREKSQRNMNQNARLNRSYEAEQDTDMNVTSGDDYYTFGEQYMGIRIHELWDYIHNILDNHSEQLIAEFKTLPHGLSHAYQSADHISNRGKNRYREMYAYDHTRVILEDDGDLSYDTQTDYINACYIDGYEKVKKFVASQGPTKNMVEDFWRMVWQLKSDKIVMLTNLIEMGATKCLLYWPKDDEETECSFGNYVIKLLDTEKYLDYNIRVIQVKKKGDTFRMIRQFHFKSWPDKDVPDSTWCLVNFWRVVDTNAASTAGPIVVHCSAGVGRTGTFIGLDNLVNQALKEGCIRPLQIVKTLRAQRVNMVQTQEQYIYLHEAVSDALYFGTHIIWSRQFGDVLAFMSQNDGIQTRLQKQFELIEKSMECSTSDVLESPEYSNVETILSESDAYKPKIKNRGSKFVQELGAIYVPNYKGKSTFLVSMSPNRDTMEEFWSLVDENNIKAIIMLAEQSSKCYQSICDLESSSNATSRFGVNKIEEKNRKGYTEKTFTFKESNREDEDYLTTVKQFEYTAWKDGYPAPGDTTSLLDMINAVLKWQPHLSESQPVLIHCRDGFSRSGIVCVLLNELQRMKYEGGHINIVESVKMMKKRQRHLISNYEQYKYCFDLVMDHIKLTDVYQNL